MKVELARPSPTSNSPRTAAIKRAASLWEDDGALIIYDAATLKEVKRLPIANPWARYNVWNKIASRGDQPLMLAEPAGASVFLGPSPRNC